jgi:hypothetical protein
LKLFLPAEPGAAYAYDYRLSALRPRFTSSAFTPHGARPYLFPFFCGFFRIGEYFFTGNAVFDEYFMNGLLPHPEYFREFSQISIRMFFRQPQQFRFVYLPVPFLGSTEFDRPCFIKLFFPAI